MIRDVEEAGGVMYVFKKYFLKYMLCEGWMVTRKQGSRSVPDGTQTLNQSNMFMVLFSLYFCCSCWTKWSSQFVTWYHISVLTSRELDCLKISGSNRISSKVAGVIWRVMTYTDLPTTICTNEHNRIPLTVPQGRELNDIFHGPCSAQTDWKIILISSIFALEI